MTILRTGLVVLAFTTGCVSAPPSEEDQRKDVAKLPACFAALEQFRVTTYRTGYWDLFIYARGSFTKGQSRTPDGSKPKTFDDQAEADLLAIQKAVNGTGVRIDGIRNARYDDAGKLAYAEFELPSSFSRWSYAYSANYKALPASKPREIEYTRIDANWYLIWEDWN